MYESLTIASYPAYRYAELCTKVSGFLLLHNKNKYKNIFSKMLKDVGIEVPRHIKTRLKCSMHGGDDSMQKS